MTRIFSGRKTGFGARQGLAFGLSLLCAVSLVVMTAGPALALAPDAPTDVVATAGDASATVTWTAPSDGGSPITSYTVTVSGGVPGPITVFPPFSTPVSRTVTGLTNGTAYTFTVTATNDDGTSTGTTSNSVTPRTTPGIPVGLVASAGNTSATLTWSAPSNGGSPITSYTVTVSGGAPGPITVLPPFGTPVSTTVTGLSNGTGYTFTVTATNAAGTSTGTTSNSVTPHTVPSPPTGVSAEPGNRSAIVFWVAPADNGGLEITSYTVTAHGPGSLPNPVSAPPAPFPTVSVGPLTNGVEYTFTVIAKNGPADGAASLPSNPVTPRTVPDRPTGVSVSAGDASATIAWSAPVDTGGSPIASYTVTVNGPGAPGPVIVNSPVTSTAVTGLTNGIAYTFKVTATNAAGRTGPSSATVGPVTPTAPHVPVTAASVRSGYWMVGVDGHVYPFGDALFLGDPRGQLGASQAVDLEPTPSGNGYWVVDDGGRVYRYGDAVFHGNVAGLVVGERVTSLSSTRSGNGYWIFTTRGRVLTFGNAGFFGDMSAVALNSPVLDSIPSASGNGYYMVASDGGIFAFGDALFYGSMGGTKLNAPVQSLVPDADGVGYWLVAADGGIFAFEAPFRGSMGATPLNKPVTGMVRSGRGYLMVGEDGGIFDFSGTADGFKGSLGANPPASPIVSVAVLEG